MCSYRVEVSECYTFNAAIFVDTWGNFISETSVCLYGISEDVLANLLGVAIWRCCRLTWRLLCYRELIRFSVNGCGRREEYIDRIG